MAFTKISGAGISSEAPVIINNLVGVGAKLSGIVTAASYHGDGSSLDGISVLVLTQLLLQYSIVLILIMRFQLEI